MIEHLVFLTGATAIGFGVYLVMDQLQTRPEKITPFQRWLLHSLVFGLMVAGCIRFGHEIRPGVILDARGAVLAVATIVGGYGVGAATSVVAVLVRLSLGGAGMWAGAMGLALDFLMSAALVWTWKRRERTWGGRLVVLVLCGVGVGCIETISLRWIGSPANGDALFRDFGKELFFTQVISTLLLGGLIQLQRERRRGRRVLDTALATSMDGFAWLGEDGRLREVNPMLETLTGYSRAELLGMSLAQLQARPSTEETASRLAEIRAQGRLRFESRWRRKDGREILLEVATALAPEDLGGLFGFVSDITARKQAEEARQQALEQVRHLNEVLLAIRDIGSLLNRERDRQRLLAGVCQSLLTTRGYVLVWTGRPDEASGEVKLVAHAGVSESFPIHAPIRWDDSPLGQGPTGSALRERRAVVFEDLEQDSRFAPWRSSMAAIGATSIAAVPLIYQDELFGVLTVKANRKHAFDVAEVDLLNALAVQVARALKTLDDDDARSTMLTTLALSEQRFRAYVEQAADAVFVHDCHGRFLDVNRRACESLGYSRDELLRMGVANVEAEIDPVTLEASWERIQPGQHHVEQARHRRKDGSTFPVEVTFGVFDLQGQRIFVCLVRDVTERQQTEAALRESEQRLREVLENSRDAAYKRNLLTQSYDYFSPVIASISGYTPDELRSMPLDAVVALVHPDDRASLERVMAQALAGPPSLAFQAEYRFAHKAGGYRWLQDKFTVMRNAADQPVALIGRVSDVTERKQAEEQTRLQETRLRLALDAAKMVTWELDVAAGTLRYSDNLAAMSGREDVTPYLSLTAFLEQIHPEDRERLTRTIERTVQSAVPFECDYRVRVADGSWQWLFGKGDCVLGAGGQTIQVLGVAINITERKRAEAELQQRHEELVRFNYAMVGRELRVIELKEEINALCGKLGEPPRYDPTAADATSTPPSPLA